MKVVGVGLKCYNLMTTFFMKFMDVLTRLKKYMVLCLFYFLFTLSE